MIKTSSISFAEFELMHVDEFIDDLLNSERVCDVILPRLQVCLLQLPVHSI